MNRLPFRSLPIPYYSGYGVFLLVILSLGCKCIYGSGNQLLSNRRTCVFDASLNLTGILSEEELILRELFNSTLHRLPNMQERSDIYTALKSGELSKEMLESSLSRATTFSLDQWAAQNDWQSYQPSVVYAWTVDLHPSPSACNLDIYRSINVVLHAEIDHHPFCEYYGVCSSSRLKVFGLGSGSSGFSLDPDPTSLKKEFYEFYRQQPEFQRVDVIFCSHPAANCELFGMFTEKPLILFFTTRLEFGRNDMNINWRQRVATKSRSHSELDKRQYDWVEFIVQRFEQPQKKKKAISIIDDSESQSTRSKRQEIYLTANNMFDVKYVEYFTGITPQYIPSWCGNLDSSYNLQPEWIGCELSEEAEHSYPYPGMKNDILIVPYKQRLWYSNPFLNPLRDDFRAGAKEFSASNAFQCQVDDIGGSAVAFSFTCPERNRSLGAGNVSAASTNFVIRHSCMQLRNQHAQMYRQYPAMIFIPYQTSVMTFFEIYRQNIPIFAPSLSFLTELDVKYQLVEGRVYGWPTRARDLIRRVNASILSRPIPNPNAKYTDSDYAESAKYWLQFSDIYIFPEVILFDSWKHLFDLIASVDLRKVHLAMIDENRKQKQEIRKAWHELFHRAAKHRHRPWNP